jgi:hypothetical protein
MNRVDKHRTAWALLLMVVVTITTTSAVHAGAWTQRRNGYYLKWSGNFFSTASEYNHSGDRRPIFDEHPAREDASFRDLNIGLYLEYGLFPDLTIVADLPYKFLRARWNSFIEFGGPNGLEKITIPEEHTNHGFTDLKLLGRYALFTQPFVLSLQGGPHLPLYSRDPESTAPQLGTGEFQLEAQILVGKSFWPSPFYVTGGGGYRHRNGPLNDELLYHVELGYSTKRFLLKFYLEGIRNTKQPPDLVGMPIETPIQGGGGVFPDVIVGDKHETKLAPALFYFVNEHFALQLEALSTIYGVNTTNGTTLSLAVILRR